MADLDRTHDDGWREAARARCEAATEGPWEFDPTMHCDPFVSVAGSPRTRQIAVWTSPDDYGRADAEFIAHARTDLPAALAALEAAEKERAVLRDLVRQAAELMDPHTGAIGARVRVLHADLATALTFEEEVDHE